VTAKQLWQIRMGGPKVRQRASPPPFGVLTPCGGPPTLKHLEAPESTRKHLYVRRLRWFKSNQSPSRPVLMELARP